MLWRTAWSSPRICPGFMTNSLSELVGTVSMASTTMSSSFAAFGLLDCSKYGSFRKSDAAGSRLSFMPFLWKHEPNITAYIFGFPRLCVVLWFPASSFRRAGPRRLLASVFGCARSWSRLRQTVRGWRGLEAPQYTRRPLGWCIAAPLCRVVVKQRTFPASRKCPASKL